ncbi:MAG: bifunctional 4-hydroxy-2-oxoglutarate aldolase/2-dehydro-3-deoxy-phosphogluconate aldolase [Pirellulales bacterium]
MSKQSTIDRMLRTGVIAILRTDDAAQLLEVCDALIAGGVDAIEVTMTTPDALTVVREATSKLGQRICMGVGTVLDEPTARMAMLAGAEYVVTPVMRPEVIAACRRYSVPVICGAMTPTEALAAHEAGADFVKIFPADNLGPTYIKNIKGPLPQIEIIPTGGIGIENCGDFIRAGCVAVGVGGTLVGTELLEKRDWPELTRRAESMVAAVATARGR